MKGSITVEEKEKGWKWWIRFVLVPIVAGGGIIALFINSQFQHQNPSEFVCAHNIQITIFTSKGNDDQRVTLLRSILTGNDKGCIISKVVKIQNKDLEVRYFNESDSYSAALIGAYIVEKTNINISIKYLPEYSRSGPAGSIEIWLD